MLQGFLKWSVYASAGFVIVYMFATVFSSSRSDEQMEANVKVLNELKELNQKKGMNCDFNVDSGYYDKNGLIQPMNAFRCLELK